MAIVYDVCSYMIRYCFVLLLVQLFGILPVKSQDGTDSRILQPAAMQQDFNYLRKALEDTHPGLYVHQTKQAVQFKMDSLYSLLQKPMSFYRFNSIIAYLIAQVKCEHTTTNPYPNNQLKENIVQWKLVPLSLYFIKNRAYVSVNRTRDTSIHLGDEVISINRHPIDSIEKELFKYVPADGNIETSKETTLNYGTNFNRWYYLFIERPDVFNIVFKTADGKLKERQWKDELTLNYLDINAINNPANKQILAIDKRSKKNKDNCSLEIMADNKTAVLWVRSFDEKKKLMSSFEQFFDKINQKKITNLIIDLHNNPGGNEAAAADLFSYLISSPKKFMTNEYVITDKDEYLKLANLPPDMLSNKSKYLYPENEGKFYIKEETQGELEICQPKAQHFTGKVYFYVNGGTASAASTLAAVANSNGIGTFIGEETGGAYFGGGSAVGLNLKLPNSHITAYTSIIYSTFATQGKHDKSRGVIPNYSYAPSFSQLIAGDNSWKEYVMQLIQKGQ